MVHDHLQLSIPPLHSILSFQIGPQIIDLNMDGQRLGADVLALGIQQVSWSTHCNQGWLARLATRMAHWPQVGCMHARCSGTARQLVVTVMDGECISHRTRHTLTE